MDLAYAAADIVISRSGALSVSEITALLKPAILIPSPLVAEDHQTKNAVSLVKQNAAVLLNDSEAPDRIVETVKSLINDSGKLDHLKLNLSHVYSNRDAAKTIAEEILKLIPKT
jgi:UDP-N-acetylglucosamine--N-acetylmuramyl-(pentapeptide) pyrophosphoryl-undecaprenol N-acetylglucosamine transferase